MQRIVNLLNSYENEYSKFATKRQYVIDSERKEEYSHHNPIKFLSKPIESNLCDYSDAYILVTRDIAVTGGNTNTKEAFKNCASYEKCLTEIDGTLVDEADFINIAVPMKIRLNTVTTILILQEAYGNLKEMKQILTRMYAMQTVLH